MPELGGWPDWPLGDPRGVARYATEDTAQLLGRVPGASDALAGPEGPGELARLLYERFASWGGGIGYAPASIPFGAAGELQRIRTPNELLTGAAEGTCIDLVALFCGACLHYGLFPLVILLDGAPGHAVAAVARREKRDAGRGNWDLEMREDRDAVRPFLHAGERRELGLLTDAAALARLVDRRGWIPIDCTGFAETRRGEDRDADQRWSFDTAVDKARGWIERAADDGARNGLYAAVDVAHLQGAGFAPWPLPGVTPAILLRGLLEKVGQRLGVLPRAFGRGGRSLSDVYTAQIFDPVRPTASRERAESDAGSGEPRDPGPAGARPAEHRTPDPGSTDLPPPEPVLGAALLDRDRERHLVVEGGPGTGKSSFLKHVALGWPSDGWPSSRCARSRCT